MKNALALIVALLALATTAGAQEAQETTNTSNIKASDVAPKEETQKDIDTEITNARMRATLGAKSKWSLKSAFGYNGGSVERPAARVRPNYRAGANIPALSSLSGTVGIKYSLSARDSVSFGTGVLVYNPFHGDLSRSTFLDPRNGKNRDRYSASTPYLDYSRAYKVGGLQMISSATYSHFTEPDTTRDMNGIGNVSFDQTVLADLGESSWSAGIALSVDTTIYKGGMSEFAKSEGAQQDDFGYGLYPFAEYAFNDKYSFRTVFGYFQMIHYRGDIGASKGNVISLAPYQSMGIGMALTRDLYLYPNVQFTPLDIRGDRTNVALSANINL